MEIKLTEHSDSPSGDFRYSLQFGNVVHTINIDPEKLVEQESKIIEFPKK